ncbi:MAG: DUF2892 domain-containing protein [Verrucomicrobia bacterium]|nr:DUF2892 domain-containing protein [Verrucomicrobiota bacterium]
MATLPPMRFFSPNISTAGRVARGICGLLCLGAAALLRGHTLPALALLMGGLFTLFEAARGWCIARACGIKTPL